MDDARAGGGLGAAGGNLEGERGGSRLALGAMI
jgi:hypothetical protein